MRFRCKGIIKKRATFGVYFFDSKKCSLIMPLVQFSFKNPWYVPKLDKKYFGNINGKKKDNVHGWLMGWLFFYIGVCITE